MAYRLGFVMEQTLGQITHTLNLQHWVKKDPDVVPTWIPITFESSDLWTRLPMIRRNWTLRASLQARARVHAVLRSERLDGLFFHTQVTALFSHGLMTKIPTVVSMDATPLNFDAVGAAYNHVASDRRIETVKNALTRRTFRRARRLISWHAWGKQSLVTEYGASADKVSVIPPGIDLERWNFPRRATRDRRPVRLLFVGGDFERKGGETLLAAFRQELIRNSELDIVTRAHVNTEGLTNVRVHRDLGPNDSRLMGLFGRADIFILPTLADVLPLAVMEAMASGLPLVTTSVGALGEHIDDGVTGFLVPPNDVHALAQATVRLVRDAELRGAMGLAARRRAETLFDGSLNYARLLEVCKRCVDEGSESGLREITVPHEQNRGTTTY